MAVEAVGIPQVNLGNQGLQVSKLGYGCMGLTGIYNSPVPEEDGIAILKHAFSKGITFFDTSDIYGADHANEKLVGKALKQLPREKIQLATKFGVVKIDQTGMVVKGTAEYVRSCCEASLKRLDVDYIDLYYVHRIDKSVPIEETMGELKKLVEEGKIRYIGLSEASPNTIRRAHAVHPITSVQMEYSLLTRDIEEEIIPICRELGIGIVPYSPTGRGFFGGKAVVGSLPANSSLQSHPRFTGQNLENNKIFYIRIEELAKKHGCSPVQLALAWVLQGDDMVPIPGTTKIKNLDENIGALGVKLTKDDAQQISDAVPILEVAGPRTYESFLHVSYHFADTPLPKDVK
ncbi:perakine reductase-like isoform X1 [Rhododendron vialii]|uniref:perakine reductase-like isoform X1 n=1 Tax=Rhododendron vialii TaxID=182163 RepID=UPI00265F4474|nr:perakine reductase-like isoform X1 [Rhododendron vialii]